MAFFLFTTAVAATFAIAVIIAAAVTAAYPAGGDGFDLHATALG
jgi:hypothetical protein